MWIQQHGENGRGFSSQQNVLLCFIFCFFFLFCSPPPPPAPGIIKYWRNVNFFCQKLGSERSGGGGGEDKIQSVILPSPRVCEGFHFLLDLTDLHDFWHKCEREQQQSIHAWVRLMQRISGHFTKLFQHLLSYDDKGKSSSLTFFFFFLFGLEPHPPFPLV